MKDYTKKIISGKDRKQLISRLEHILNEVDEFLPKKIQLIKYSFSKRESVYTKNNQIVLIDIQDLLIPHIKLIRTLNHKIPTVSVDTGAIKFVVNGADVMRPGVVKIDENVVEGGLILVSESSKGGILCFGIAMYDAVDMEAMKSGKCIKNIHHLKDKYWDMKF